MKGYMEDFKLQIDNYCLNLKKVIDSLDVESVNTVIQVLKSANNSGKNIFLMGNGCSAATVSHLSCDLNKVASSNLKNRFKVVSLNDSVSFMTAIANDVNYESVFVEQLKNFFIPGDVVIGISGSGNSKNIIQAIDYANEREGITIGFSGYGGGLLIKKAKYNIHVNVNDMQLVEDLHVIIGHIITKAFNPNC